MIRIVVACLLLFSAARAYAYSDAYCKALDAANGNAMESRDWERVLKTASEFERNCQRIVPPSGIAFSIAAQALAFREFKQYREALVATERCLKRAQFAVCHVERAKTLDELGRLNEADVSYVEARRAAALEIERLNVQIPRSSSTSERDELGRELQLHRFIVRIADQKLNDAKPSPSQAPTSAAQVPAGTGERLAKNTMALVSFAEMGNLGAKDPECEGTRFPVTNIDVLVETEIAPVFDALARADRKPYSVPRAQILAELKQLPYQKVPATVIPDIYDLKKREAYIAFGADGVCAALSTMVQTVMQQRRLELRDIMQLVR